MSSILKEESPAIIIINLILRGFILNVLMSIPSNSRIKLTDVFMNLYTKPDWDATQEC